MIIKMLPLEVSQKIKAGEVVEDPASVIRELLDNSIDSLATEIDIEVVGAGFTSISIKDNGSGMKIEDLEICFLEHTTSKIQSFEDIFTLETRGFRGEALASICKVSHVTINSGHQDATINYTIMVHDGKMVEEEQSAYKKGTSIKVENLFYNMPVRRQFLKSSIKEMNKIKKEVLLKALAFPCVRFTLRIDSKSIAIVYPQANSFQERIIGTLPLLNPLHHFKYHEPEFSIEGFITGLNQTFDHSSYLYVYVNNHPISSKNFYGLIKKAVSGLIPNNKYLGGVIYIQTQANNIDPNIHPAKKEIKIFNESSILTKLYHSIVDTLRDKPDQETLGSFHQPENNIPPSTVASYNRTQEDQPISIQERFIQEHSLASYNRTQEDQPISIQERFIQEHSLHPIEKIELLKEQSAPHFVEQQSHLFSSDTNYTVSPGLYLGTLFGTYWLYEVNDFLYMIDFHAAHERKRYEDLKVTYKDRAVESQGVLTSEIVLLTPQESLKFEQSYSLLKNIGFEAQMIGENVLSVSSFPAVYKKTKDWQEDLHLFLLEEHLEESLFPIKDYLLKRIACRYSYMSQDTVSSDERALLCKQIFEHRFPHTCPHGRPFLYAIKKQSIESQFLRK